MSLRCQPSLRYDGSTVKPGVPAGTMSAETCGDPSAFSPVRAVTVTTEVMSVPLLVMKAFAPSSTQPSSSRFARVRGVAVSDPAPGSVSPKPASAFPATRSGSQRCFCSSEP